MARGTGSHSLWHYQVSALRIEQCDFRMRHRADKNWIYIRQMKGGKVVREFSSDRFRWYVDDEVAACANECRAAHRRGYWKRKSPGKAETEKVGLTWRELADSTLTLLHKRIAREGSRKNAEGHLKQLAKKTGTPTAKDLERWALERCPIDQPSAFRNRIETLSHINKTGELKLDATIAVLKDKRPTGAAKKEQDRRTQKIKAIPADSDLEQWLDSLEGNEQWVLAMIATYGLRPSEAWHVVSIDDDGWVHIPGDGKTKTEEHFAPPQPSHWVERYQLRENFEQYKTELNERWPIKWQDRAGLSIPTNNSVVSNALYHRIYKQRIARLYVDDEWVRPYDLRHSYAIRCETSEDPQLVATPSEEFAKWLGHTLDVHKGIYLKWMSAERRATGLKARVGSQRKNPAEAGLTDEILAKLEKLEMLEKLMAS